MTLAIDRFRAKPLRADLELQAEENASYLISDANALLGYLQASVAIDLERGRWRSRDRLAVDLRTVQIARTKR